MKKSIDDHIEQLSTEAREVTRQAKGVKNFFPAFFKHYQKIYHLMEYYRRSHESHKAELEYYKERAREYELHRCNP